jgi:hypothetical protein
MTYGTMEKIQTVTITGSTAANIEFTNIPQTYNDLVIYISARSNRATGEDGLGLRLNNITTGYTYRNLTSNGSSVASANTNFEQVWASRIPAANSTGSTFSNNYIHIPNYAGTTTKSYMTDGVTENNGTEAYIVLQAINNSTTSAITSITLTSINASLVQHSTATLYGITRVPTGAKATGGVITEDSTYWYHTFTSSGIFSPTQNIIADMLVVAGGGSGGSALGGGGGAGGLLGYTNQSLIAQNYTITIGAGGAAYRGAGPVNSQGSSGSNSQFASLTASIGGGRGGTYNTNNAGASGGSGGGAGGSAGAAASGGTATSGQGNNGAAGGSTGTGQGGGGGAGASGSSYSGKIGGAGGAGSSSYSSWGIATNTGENSSGTVYFAGGGGGCMDQTGTAAGGLGGGGVGVYTTGSAGDGMAFTGGGGGGHRESGTPTTNGGGNGGSGIVIVRYTK